MSASAPSALLRSSLQQRVEDLDWPALTAELDAQGCAVARSLLTQRECAELVALYGEEHLFRSRVVMARHGFGSGEYKYFSYPLPEPVAELRRAFYPKLAPTANRWSASLRSDVRYPDDHQSFIARCHEAGQLRPTPLLLSYTAGDYNCLHQDLYGEHVFPIQVALLLSEPGRDFSGGEFVLTEQRPRAQSRATVLPLRQGDAALFAVSQRPAVGKRGTYRVALRHGVSRLHSGTRHTLGIIFHDAS